MSFELLWRIQGRVHLQAHAPTCLPCPPHTKSQTPTLTSNPCAARTPPDPRFNAGARCANFEPGCGALAAPAAAAKNATAAVTGAVRNATAAVANATMAAANSTMAAVAGAAAAVTKPATAGAAGAAASAVMALAGAAALLAL